MARGTVVLGLLTVALETILITEKGPWDTQPVQDMSILQAQASRLTFCSWGILVARLLSLRILYTMS